MQTIAVDVFEMAKVFPGFNPKVDAHAKTIDNEMMTLFRAAMTTIERQVAEFLG